jgi:hypothetical protein
VSIPADTTDEERQRVQAFGETLSAELRRGGFPRIGVAPLKIAPGEWEFILTGDDEQAGRAARHLRFCGHSMYLRLHAT